MRISRSLTVCTALLSGAAFGFSTTASFAAPANTAPASAPVDAAKTPAPDPSMPLAKVNNQVITVKDLQHAVANLPPQVRQLSQQQQQQILPLLLDQLVKQAAIRAVADKTNIPSKPEVKAAIKDAADKIIQNAYLEEKVAPQINDAALKAYYQSHIANKKPEKEIHARHILVSSEETAKDIIKQLQKDVSEKKKGDYFAELAKKYSTDKATASQNGGDLGWFPRDAMIPEFTQAAFAMKPDTFSQTPVHTQYGWHVIEVLGVRDSHIPTFEEAKDSLSRELAREEVNKVVDAALKEVKITKYENGKPVAAATTGK